MCLSLEIFCLFPLVLVSSLCVIVWLSFYSFTQLSCATTDVPYQACLDVPYQACLDVPYQACLDVPYQACLDVPYQVCLDVPYQVCYVCPLKLNISHLLMSLHHTITKEQQQQKNNKKQKNKKQNKKTIQFYITPPLSSMTDHQYEHWLL